MAKDTDNFDFALVEDEDKLLKEEKKPKQVKAKPVKKAKQMGRPKKQGALKEKQISTYISYEEYQQLTEKLAGVPVSVALRNFVFETINKH